MILSRSERQVASLGLVLLLPIAFLAFGCTTSYHVSQVDDGRSGRLGFDEFAKECRGHKVEILLVNGSRYHGFELVATPDSVAWHDSLGTSIISMASDSVRTISWRSVARGMGDGLLLGIPGNFVALGITAFFPYYALVAWPYTLALGPAIGAIIGGLVTHTYRFRIIPQHAPERAGLEPTKP